MQVLVRWLYVLINFRNYGKELNRRVGVENKLWDIYHGKKPLPDRKQCGQLAKELGIPTYMSKFLSKEK